jgi:hypothetical protein
MSPSVNGVLGPGVGLARGGVVRIVVVDRGCKGAARLVDARGEDCEKRVCVVESDDEGRLSDCKGEYLEKPISVRYIPSFCFCSYTLSQSRNPGVP